MKPKEDHDVQEFKCEWADLPPDTPARPRPPHRPRPHLPEADLSSSGPSLQEFICEFVDLPPGTKARPRPPGKERRLPGEDSVEKDQYHELLALHRAVMEAKFNSTNSKNNDLLADPCLARAANRILEQMISVESVSDNGEAATKWVAWRQLNPSRKEWKIVEEAIRACGKWASWSIEERSHFLDTLVSPLTVSDEDREKLLNINETG